MGIIDALLPWVGDDSLVCIIVKDDLALSLGAAIGREWYSNALLVCVDGVEVRDFDVVDIGRRMPL